MKLRVPVGCCAASHAGEEIEISEYGSVGVDDSKADALLSHGFTHFEGGTKSSNLATMDSNEAISHGLNSTRKTRRKRSPGKPPTAPAEAPQPTVGHPASESFALIPIACTDDISTLNRKGLFALLRANRISVSLPITNEQLRTLARSASAG